LATLDKYFSKVEVVDTPKGKQLVVTPIPDIENKFLLSDTSPKKSANTDYKFVCEWIEKCEFYIGDGFCSYPKYCSQKGVVKIE
jgi:hypothetical protein